MTYAVESSMSLFLMRGRLSVPILWKDGLSLAGWVWN